MNSPETQLVNDLCHKADILEYYLTHHKYSAIKKDHMAAIKLRVDQLTRSRQAVEHLTSPSPE